MRFENPHFLWFLLILPLTVLYTIYLRRGDIPSLKFSSFSLLPEAKGAAKWDMSVLTLGFLRTLVFALIILALARPQKGLRTEETTTKATDILVCLDASRSMLAVDFKPENRFQVAKNVISDFAKNRQHDRLGLVLFAAHAITQCPLTTDRSAFLEICNSLEVGVIAPDQTAIGIGLATAINRIKNSKAKSKVIILLTDGANNAGNIDPITAAKTAQAFGVKVYVIGAGTPGETMIPIDHPMMGRQMVPIKSDLDEDTLLKIAVETGGKYFRAKSENSLKTIFKDIDALEKTDIKTKQYIDYKELYFGFLLVAVILLMIELILSKTLFRTLP